MPSERFSHLRRHQQWRINLLTPVALIGILMSSKRLSVHRHVFPIALKPNRTKSRNLQVHKYVKALTVNVKETQLENMHMEPYSARPVVSMSGSFAPRRPSAMSGDTFSCPQHLGGR